MRIFALIALLSLNLWGVDPASIKVKVYGAWMSKSEFCTLPMPLFNGEEAYFLDFVGKPELGSLDNTDSKYNGTYKCIILRLNEIIKFAPKTTAGYCIGGQEYTTKICGGALITIDPESHEVTTCSASTASEDTVFLYMSTASTASSLATSENPFVPPTDSQTRLGLKLDAPWVVNGAYTTDLVVNAYDKITSSGTTCILDTPSFSFKSAN